MGTEKIQMKTVTVRNPEDGKDYVTMKAAEGAAFEVSVFRDRYLGYGYPYYFRIKSWPKGGTWAMYYLSPSRYRQDFLSSRKDYSVDLYGSLYRQFVPTDEYIDNWAKSDLKDMEDLKLIKRIPFVSNDKILQKRGPEKTAAAKEKGMSLKRYYYCGMVHHYSYLYKGKLRMRAYSAVLEAEDLETVKSLPPSITSQLNNPFMKDIAQMALNSFSNARYDQTLGWVYSLLHYLDWRVTQKLVLDAAADSFESLYQQVFLPTLNGGITISDTVWKDFKERQDTINRANQEKRKKEAAVKEEKRRAAEETRKREEEARRKRQEHWDYMRKTQQEISDIRKSAWENTQKSNAKVNEMWTDTIRGDTRFVDKYGNEHVLHTLDRHAYKSGDTYVTSDSPLDHGWDWEELEKKKY